MNRRDLIVTAAAAAGAPKLAFSQTSESLEKALWSAIFGGQNAFTQAQELLLKESDPALVFPLIIAQRFARVPSGWFDLEMQRLAGEEREGWFDWMLWQEERSDLTPPEWYYRFKRDMYLQIDPNFDDFLQLEALQPEAARIRFEEVTWGGVRKDGIPSLDFPELIDAGEAGYLRDDDLVFGVSINGDTRAYPLRIMGWHEMFNEVIGGVPVALAYCTLCGSGILFETQLEDRAEPFIFGSSGFLYRSNKLMFDRETNTLWNQFTGEPVIGELAQSGIRLKQQPVVIAPWSEWRAQNPDTLVLSLNTGHNRNYGSGVVYKDYFGSPNLMFPTAVNEVPMKQKDYVFGIREYGAAKAWPLTAFKDRRVINDRIGQTNVVLIGDEAGRTVRAYERGNLEFAWENGPVSGGAWQVTEAALTGPGGQNLPRVAGHVAYWFAWSGYLGDVAELWTE